MRLQNKTALITGGATGIGLACSRLFVQEGARVAIFGRRQDRLDQAKQELGDGLLAVQGDITLPADIKRLVDTVVKELGRIDILINNAGTFAPAPIQETTDEAWEETFIINMRGVFQLSRQVLSHMIEQGTGNLIHISSVLGLRAVPGTAAYNASKGALNQFSQSIAVEFGGQGIRSNTICPGMIETEMTEELRQDAALMEEFLKRYPLGRFGQPEDVAQACLFMASDASAFITGTVLPVDGGCTALL
ncbi:MAG: glucose 1-dehydrogenase [Nitrospinaceae bacterium]|nr:SDR family oxidoreductase [Nitrospinaceae bacterium]NIR56238.1 SDR family oxidoreductase [Nitrospinaceae bacterium]NIS86694.1 SDR family oxidoreductase [Nitrospinaceae bacterium]NIT83527.1 SDR family oxidoreductase [Nitrospinaceae bacterium]NIU45732.1 SDR family oxidoreductase [Nitrospinaceae bacterium]